MIRKSKFSRFLSVLSVTGFALSMVSCNTTDTVKSSTSADEAKSRLGYVRSKDKSADFKKFEYQFSMDMDTSVNFQSVDRADFNQCKIYARERIPVETMLEPCVKVIESQALPQKMRIASLYNRGLIQQNLERETEARQDFEAVLAKDGQFGDAELAIAGLDLQSGKLADAQTRIQSALGKTLRHPAYAHYLQGYVLEEQSKFVEARTEYRRALELRPNWRVAQKRIDRIGISWPE